MWPHITVTILHLMYIVTSVDDEHLLVPIVTSEELHRWHFTKPSLITGHFRCTTSPSRESNAVAGQIWKCSRTPLNNSSKQWHDSKRHIRENTTKCTRSKSTARECASPIPRTHTHCRLQARFVHGANGNNRGNLSSCPTDNRAYKHAKQTVDLLAYTAHDCNYCADVQELPQNLAEVEKTSPALFPSGLWITEDDVDELGSYPVNRTRHSKVK